MAWLKKGNAAGGHGCQVALSEGWAEAGGEIPDAMGWRHAGFQDGTVIVEAKVSRADFLADMRKSHRSDPAKGMGKWRYYLCPEGLIQPEELPPRWGLIYALPGRGLTVVAGPASHLQRYTGKPDQRPFAEALEAFAFHERDRNREMGVLVRTLARVADPEEVNRKLREAAGKVRWMSNKMAQQEQSLKQWRMKAFETT
ncbi:MAG: hypothetical protein A2580_17820 [Hydrogenophilales bacterium RIFOXYD1_FULL_62_11]|nr:MAG: hypothetical protein A2580_17820 [Hydrogenophilales bacterium RIFOXYD1_FULL_62_11]